MAKFVEGCRERHPASNGSLKKDCQGAGDANPFPSGLGASRDLVDQEEIGSFLERQADGISLARTQFGRQASIQPGDPDFFEPAGWGQCPGADRGRRAWVSEFVEDR